MKSRTEKWIAAPHVRDEIDVTSEDSFPASDPPSWTPIVGTGPPCRVGRRAGTDARAARDEPPVPSRAVLHPTCTLVKAGGLEDLLRVARAHAEEVLLPAFAECCGFAGDKGFLHPELTASATLAEAAEVRELVARDPRAGCYSTCRTCEIGMSRAVGRRYDSLVALVHEAVSFG